MTFKKQCNKSLSHIILPNKQRTQTNHIKANGRTNKQNNMAGKSIESRKNNLIEIRKQLAMEATKVSNDILVENKIKDADTLIPLSPDFLPSPMDVVVGTGKEAKIHPGNRRLHEILKGYLERYAQAPFKMHKSLIISEIVKRVRTESPTKVGFVKMINKRWYIVGDHLSREKVSQSLRNLLHHQYRSSTQAKKQRRNLICQRIDNSIDAKFQTTQHTSLRDRFAEISRAIEQQGGNKAPDDIVLKLFTRANSEILEELKQDSSFQQSFDTSVAEAEELHFEKQYAQDAQDK